MPKNIRNATCQTISFPKGLIYAVKEHTKYRPGGISRYVVDAVDEKMKRDGIAIKDAVESKSLFPPQTPPITTPLKKSKKDLPTGERLLNIFVEEIKKENNLSEEDISRLSKTFENFIKSRTAIRKPFRNPATGNFHANQVKRCLNVGFTVDEIINHMKNAIGHEWRNWIFKEDFLKKKGFENNAKIKTTPLELPSMFTPGR